MSPTEDVMIGTGSAHGKVILSGEHSVVYGYEALATSISLAVRARVVLSQTQGSLSPFLTSICQIFFRTTKIPAQTVSLLIESELPRKSGVGSSAAVATACFRALADFFHIELSPQQLFALVQESERIAHGSPSGIDAATVISGGVICFTRQDSGPIWHQVSLQTTFPRNILLVQSGEPQESTKEMVAHVAQVAKTVTGKNTLARLGALTHEAITSFELGKYSWEWMAENHALLCELGVVSQQTQELIAQITALGGYAKITGAGGIQTHSGMVLVYHTDHEKIASVVQSYPQWTVEVGVV